MNIISKISKLLKNLIHNNTSYKIHKIPRWKREDKRLPIWVRKAVSKYKQNHNIYTEAGTNKTFYGKYYVYKFTWHRVWEYTDSGMHDTYTDCQTWRKERIK